MKKTDDRPILKAILAKDVEDVTMWLHSYLGGQPPGPDLQSAQLYQPSMGGGFEYNTSGTYLLELISSVRDTGLAFDQTLLIRLADAAISLLQKLHDQEETTEYAGGYAADLLVVLESFATSQPEDACLLLHKVKHSTRFAGLETRGQNIEKFIGLALCAQAGFSRHKEKLSFLCDEVEAGLSSLDMDVYLPAYWLLCAIEPTAGARRFAEVCQRRPKKVRHDPLFRDCIIDVFGRDNEQWTIVLEQAKTLKDGATVVKLLESEARSFFAG